MNLSLKSKRLTQIKEKAGEKAFPSDQVIFFHQGKNLRSKEIVSFFLSFFTSPYLPSILEVERTSTALNTDDAL